MSNRFTALPDSYENGVTPYDAEDIELVHGLVSNNIQAVRALGQGIEERPDADSFLVTASAGLSVNIAAGTGIAHHSTYGAVPLEKTTASTLSALSDDDTLYIYAAIEVVVDGNDSRKTGLPVFIASDTDTYDGGILLAEVTTLSGAVDEVIDRRVLLKQERALRYRGAWDATLRYAPCDVVTDGGDWWVALAESSDVTPVEGANWTALSGSVAGTTPTGTGFVHVTAGVQDGAAKLVVNADVDAAAAIAESKLALASDAAAGTASRRTLGTGATQAAAGNHTHANATTSAAGFQSAADKLKLDNATANATASTLMLRDSSGRAKVATPSAATDAANKAYVDDTVSSGAADASETVKGITQLSVAAADTATPIAVGDNDPRVAAFGASGASHSAGLVPDPGATEGSVRYLREDGTWADPADGGVDAETLQGRALAGTAPTDGQAIIWDNTGNTWKPGTISAGVLPYIQIRDEKASGVSGGEFTSGAWQTRDLNTEVHDTGSYATLASNEITLAAGTYRFQAFASSYASAEHQLRLYNATDAAVIGYGVMAYSNPSGHGSIATIAGRFTLADAKAVRLEHRCNSTHELGFGVGATWGNVNVFAEIEIWKEA